MNNEIEQGLHEKLCAFVLGEASDEVRAEMDAALAASAELRAERDQIEKTIGLVKETMATSESPPPFAASEILADAQGASRRPWYGRPAFRVAAGIATIALLGVIGYRAMKRSHLQTNPGIVANARESDVRRLRTAEERLPTPSDQPGVPVAGQEASGSAPASTPGAPPSSAPAAAEAPVFVAQSSSLGGVAGGRVIDSTALDQLDKKNGALQELHFGETIDPSQVESNLHGMQAERGASSAGASPNGLPSTPRIDPNGAAWTSYRHSKNDDNLFGARAAPSAGEPTTKATGGSEDFFLGAGAAKDGAHAFVDLRQAGLGDQRTERLRALGYADDGSSEQAVLGRDLSVIDQLRRLDPVDRDKWIEGECRRILTNCRRFPNERPRDMFFRFYGDNPFEIAALDPLSTFSVDVDTASYALARRYLNEGHIPEKAQVRTEEFVNYFKADVPAPTEGTFAIHTDLAPSRFSADKARSMLRVVVRGKDVTQQDRKPLNLTFVIDVSGSMREQNRLETVKYAIRLLASQLGGGDNIAVVAFSESARIVLPMTSVRNRSAIETALYPLQPDSNTNSEAGLQLGYSVALANINPEAQNRVVFLSDGVANVGETDPAKLSESVKPIREKGVYLNTIGVGMNNHNDTLLEQLADKGDGVCSYIDSPDEARKVIVEGFTGTFETIARDVKIQVEFDPAQVERYRLLGYENRAIADKDFRNDKVDAGEVGAGHQVTALYEIERTAGASEKPLATVRLRWKMPRNVNAPAANEEATERTQPVLASQQTSFEGAGAGYRRAVIVAQFAEFLRRSVHARGESLDDLIVEAEKLEKETHDPETGELVVLIHKSKQLVLDALPPCDDLCQAIDAVRRNSLLRCEHEMLAKELDQKLVADLEKQNADLEQRIRELLRRKLEEKAK